MGFLFLFFVLGSCSNCKITVYVVYIGKLFLFCIIYDTGSAEFLKKVSLAFEDSLSSLSYSVVLKVEGRLQE